jgi:predicted peroxiredoxin
MKWKPLSALLLCFALLAPAAASAAESVLVVVDEYDNPLRFDLAVWRAVQLKKAGYDVRVLFESLGVLNFMPSGKASEVMQRKDAGYDRVAMPGNKGRHKKDHGGQKGRDMLKELSKLGVPITLCSFSAAILGVTGDLKSSGASMSADPERPVLFSSLVPAGGRVLIF